MPLELRRFTLACTGLAVLLQGSASSVLAQDKDFAIEAGRLFVGDGASIDHATIVVRDGKIASVGEDIAAPAGLRIIRTPFAMPGMVDIHTHFSSDHTFATQGSFVSLPAKRASDRWNPGRPNIQTSLEGGMTTAVVRPNSENFIGGTSFAIKMIDAPFDEALLREPVDVKVSFRNEFRKQGAFLETVRPMLLEAREYARRWSAYKASAIGPAPHRDLNLEALATVMEKRLPIHAHGGCDGIHEYETISALIEEFDLGRLTCAHAVGAYSLAIAQRPDAQPDLNFNVGPAFLSYPSLAATHPLNTAAALARLGRSVSIQTDGGYPYAAGTISSYWLGDELRNHAALLYRYGLPEKDAVGAITGVSAAGADLDNRVGLIKPGLDADLLLYDRHPLEFSTRPRTVIVDGVVRHDAPAKTASTLFSSGTAVQRPLDLPRDLQFPATFALAGATVYTGGAAAPIPNGILLVRNGRVAAVGSSVKIPKGMRVFDMTGRYVSPGYVYALSAAGRYMKLVEVAGVGTVVSEGGPAGLDDFAFHDLRSVGVTTVMSSPVGSGFQSNLLDGRGDILKTGGGEGNAARFVRHGPAVVGIGKVAVQSDKPPGTETSTVAFLRQALVDAREGLTLRKEQRSARQAEVLQTLETVLKGESPLILLCTDTADVQAAMRIRDEFDVKMVLHAGLDVVFTAELAKQLAARSMAVIQGSQAQMANLTVLEAAGVGFALRPREMMSERARQTPWRQGAMNTYSGDPSASAAVSVGFGASEAFAFASITTAPAQMIDMSYRVGTLEPGKDADFVILSAPPLATAAFPQLVAIEGKIVARNELSDFITAAGYDRRKDHCRIEASMGIVSQSGIAGHH